MISHLTRLPDQLLRHLSLNGKAGCWEWNGCRDGCGYGMVRWQRKTRRVHRVVASLYLGLDIESKIQALHRCDNPACFNPDHLYKGGYKENMRDRDEQGRQWQMKKEMCKNGHSFSGENLVLVPSKRRQGKFVRRCRECFRAYHRKYARKKCSTFEGRKRHNESAQRSYWRKKKSFSLDQVA